MAATCKKEVAQFETTRRLLSHLINEELCSAFVNSRESDNTQWLYLVSIKSGSNFKRNPAVKVQHIESASMRVDETRQITSLVRPQQLKPPVFLIANDTPPRAELSPGAIFQFVYAWFGSPDIESTKDSIALELQNAAANQGGLNCYYLPLSKSILHLLPALTPTETWLDVEAQQPRLDIFSPAIQWEKTLITGHPTHPVSPSDIPLTVRADT
jgi:hypothetical protein